VPRTPAPGPRTRRIAAAAVLALLAAVSLSTVVLNRPDQALVAISRLGEGTRLAPARLAFSPWPLESRHRLGRVGGLTVLEAPLELPAPGGAAFPARLHLELDGGGPLPVAASRVRALGWEAAWAEWARGALRLTPEDTTRVLRGSAAWTAIFPTDPTGTAPDLAARVTGSAGGVKLTRATVELAEATETVRAAARDELRRRYRRGGRLVVVGLDALDWDLVDDLTARGIMPNLRSLIQRGSQAVVEVPRPLISPVVWTTIATGVPPDVHGVLDFLEPDPGGGAPHPVTGASRLVPAVWEMLAAGGRSTATIAWWATFPAQAPPGGRVYSDRLTEQLLGLSARIPALADPPAAEGVAQELAVAAAGVTPAMLAPLAAVGAEELAAAQRAAGEWDSPIAGLAKLVAATLTVERLTDHELEAGTDVVLSYLEGTDIVGHLFAPYRPPAMPGADPARARRFAGVVDRYHAQIDAWLGLVVARLSPGDTVVIVSDHGFTWGGERPRVPAGTHTATAVWWHRPEGVFIAAGPAVAAEAKRGRMAVLDVAPTLLFLAGSPRDADMVGSVPAWLSERAAPASSTVRYAALAPRLAPARVELPPEARAEELAKLRALGYLAGGDSTTGATPIAAPPSPAEPPALPTPQFDRVQARQLTNLGSSLAERGDRAGAERALRQAINADPSFASAHYNLSLLLRKDGRIEEADRAFWRSVDAGVADREMAVVRLALDTMERGDAERARAVFAEGRRRFPDSAPIWLNSGVFLGEHGLLDEARACLERAVRLAADNPAAHRNLAAALLATGDSAGARRELAEAVRLAPGDEALRRQLDALGGPPSS